MGQVFAIAAGKDGSGKTTFAVNMAATLAKAGTRVALVDMNRGMRGLDLALGLESAIVYDLDDWFCGNATLKQVEVQDSRFFNLSLFSCSQNRSKSAPGAKQVAALYKELRGAFDFVLVEVPGGPCPEMLLAATAADGAVLVTTREQECLRNTETVSQMLRHNGVEKRCLLINKVCADLFDSDYLDPPEAIVERLRIPLLGMLPQDENFTVAAAAGDPIVCDANYVADAFRKMAQGLIR